MNAKIFKNIKHARRRLPEVFLCIQAVDKKLKPSYLWDAFAADASEIKLYVEELYFLNLVDHKLNVICIDGTMFVTLYDSLKLYLDTFTFANIDIINVSKTVSVPSIVTMEEKIEILKPIIKCWREILDNLYNGNANYAKNIDYKACNPSTLFGMLLGYPVLYWFSHQSPDSEFTCLSMLPLKVHRIVTTISLPSSYAEKYVNCKKHVPEYHELFKFSIPDNVSQQTDSLVNSWFHSLLCKSQSNAIFSNLNIKTDIISLPSVSM